MECEHADGGYLVLMFTPENSPEELERRRKAWTPPAPPHIPRGYLRLYAAAASSADQGAVLQPERLSRLP